MKGLSSSKEPAFDVRRFHVASALVGVAFALLVVRVYWLQILHGEEYREKSQSNFVQERRVAHSRGLIYDQGGQVLVDNRPSHDVYMTVTFLPDSERSLRQIAEPLALSREEIKRIDHEVLSAVHGESSDAVVLKDALSEAACRDVETRAERYDLSGVVVEWGSSYDEDGCRVLVHARRFPSRAAVFERLRGLLGFSREEMDEYVKRALEKARGLGRFKPTLLVEDVEFDAYAAVRNAVSLGEVPGISLQDSQRRRYLYGSQAAHVLGFLNEISPGELKRLREEGYRLGDVIGRRGVEAAFEDTLRGRDGVEPVVVDAKGREQGDAVADVLLGKDRRIPATAGQSLVLSIDSEMQRAAEAGFLGRAGSVVAIEARTGFVLAMASFPAFDPNLVTGRKSAQIKRALDSDPDRPWGNKAIQDHYAPGSTFKAITAIAGLRTELINEHKTRMCPGYFRLGSSVWRCYNRGGHGPIALVKALQYSCDTYFYSLGYEMGPDSLAETGRLMGFGSRTGIGIDREIPGIMPDKAYYERRLGYYTPGLVVNNSIGQGDVTVTPIQLAMAYAAIANGGAVLKPQIVREVIDGDVVERNVPEVKAYLHADAHLLELVRESLSHVTEPGGTAAGLMWRRDLPELSQWLRESGVKIGGKTGTAQVVRLSKNIAHLDPEDVAYEQRDHAWFVALAPADQPEIVVVVMTEHGGFGGSMSAPVAAQVVKAWYESVRGHGRYALDEDGVPRALKEEPVAPDAEEAHVHEAPETGEGHVAIP